MPQPKISIIMPTFNQGRYIEKSIRSILEQDEANIELIIIDGGSTDDTVEVIRRHEDRIAFWVSEKDRGQSHAINKGMQRATGDYLTWLNSDDWYLPGAVKAMVSLLEQTGADVVVGAGTIVDGKGEQIYAKAPTSTIDLDTLFHWHQGGNFMQPSSAFRRSAWAAAGELDEAVHIALDLDLWLRMAKAGCRYVTTDQHLSVALSHPDAKTTAFKDLMRLDCLITIIRHGGEPHVRQRLQEILVDLTSYRSQYERIVGHPLVRFAKPVLRLIDRLSTRRKSDAPPWSGVKHDG
jgi:glycosyltransferase involved in cell wall biosynthesis